MTTIYGPTTFEVSVPAGQMADVHVGPAKKDTSARIGIDAKSRGRCYHKSLGSWSKVIELFVARGIADNINLSSMTERYTVHEPGKRDRGHHIGLRLLMATDGQIERWMLAWGCCKGEVLDRLIRHYTLQ